MSADRILILDFGSQYTQLIARRVRECKVYCEIFPFDISPEKIKAFNPKGIILSGGPETTTASHTPRAPKIVFELGCPLLGICYGMQTMAVQLGGKVSKGKKKEFGQAEVVIQDPLFFYGVTGGVARREGSHFRLSKMGYPQRQDPEGQTTLAVWMSHGDQVSQLPKGFKIIAESDNTPIAAMADETRKFYGLQFHPEVTHTSQGLKILKNFVNKICGAKSNWTPHKILEESIEAMRNLVGSDEVILGLSGGVDSSVVAALLHRAIGNQLTCVFVDHGLLRLNEPEQVMSVLGKQQHIRIIQVNAQKRFLHALKNVTDPEKKRKLIGRLFIEEFEKVSKKMPKAKWLAQGTIYPDVIESAGTKSKAHVIKSHHNVGGLPAKMKLKLCEPLRFLFKDEVRKLGLELGLPKELVFRHPFPGPGLAVRCLDKINVANLLLLKKADIIFLETLRKHHYYDRVSQAFAVLLPVNTVGVVGDARHYAKVVGLRAVQTTDFMTAHAAYLPEALLVEASTRICNEIPGVSRVVYDITSKPPATIEWE